MTNENGRVLNDFSENYNAILKSRYGTADLDEAQIKSLIIELNTIEAARLAGRHDESRELTPQEQGLLLS